MFDCATSSGILLFILFYLKECLLNDIVVNFLFGLKDWHVSGMLRFLFRPLRDLLIWLESRCHHFDLWSRRVWSKDPNISCRSAISVGQDRLPRIKHEWLSSGRLIFWCSYDLLEAISTLSQNWLIVGKCVRLNFEVALIVRITLYFIPVIGARFESSNWLICRSLGSLMNLIRILEVSVLEHFMHLIVIFVLFISVTKIVSSRKFDLFLRQTCHAG